MNWKRVWTGGVLAGIVIFLLDLILSWRVMGAHLNTDAVPFLIWSFIPALLSGFLLSGLYALARPRLGPGPATAIVMGSVGFGLMCASLLPQFMGAPLQAGLYLLFTWGKCVTATYFAGWQYIEKAP